MSGPCFVIAGTDTDVGKTVFAAALTAAIGADYWKPVQAGLGAQGETAGESDSDTVARLAGLAAGRILPEAYRLRTPCSPHQAAAIDGVYIDETRLSLPRSERPLVVEAAGGVLVPLRRDLTNADLFATWGAPVVLVARTALGTINHSLLSIEALRRRGIALHGIAFIGAANEESEAVIAQMGGVRRLGRLDRLDPLTPEALALAFAAGFDVADFR